MERAFGKRDEEMFWDIPFGWGAGSLVVSAFVLLFFMFLFVCFVQIFPHVLKLYGIVTRPSALTLDPRTSLAQGHKSCHRVCATRPQPRAAGDCLDVDI